MAKRHKYKIGDKVKIIDESGTIFDVLAGQTGTVLKYTSEPFVYLVRFEHNGGFNYLMFENEIEAI